MNWLGRIVPRRVRRGKGPHAARLRRLAPLPRRIDTAAWGSGLPGEVGKTRTDQQEPMMSELRSVDPRTLVPNPNNPRTVATPKEMDAQLVASIRTIGLIHPPRVREEDGKLVITAGHRRVRASVAAKLKAIDVHVVNDEPTIDAMASMSENLVRVGMNPVDTWRGITRLEAEGWNEQAIADALALPVRAVRKLKLLAKLHPPMLDVMAKGSMPSEEQLRTIAAAPIESQAEVWKALKPKKGQDVTWWEIARALTVTRIPYTSKQFSDELGEEYGVTWQEDLFAPAGQENRYTTNVDGFFGAQQAHMQANLPANGVIVPVGEYGAPQLPKGAERVYSAPKKTDKIGHYVNPRTHEVETVVFRVPPPKKPAKAGTGGSATADHGADENDGDSAAIVVKIRPDVTQKGDAMVGDYRTAALATALDNTEIPLDKLVGLLVLALAADNVSVQSSTYDLGPHARADIRERITEGGVLSLDHDTIHTAARDMLKIVLSCRTNQTNSGVASRLEKFQQGPPASRR
jgi:ParB family chromosome partitioning protein